MKWRIAATAAFSIVFAAWAYLDIKLYEERGSLYTLLHEPAVAVAMIVLAILTGIVVGRAWVLLALVGPIAALAYLQEGGYRGPDGISALSSPPSIFMLIWFGLMLLLGVGISHLWRHLRDQRRTAQP